MPPLRGSIDIWSLTDASQAAAKPESHKEAVVPGHGTVRAIRSAGETNIRREMGFSPMTHKPSLFAEVPARSVARP